MAFAFSRTLCLTVFSCAPDAAVAVDSAAVCMVLLVTVCVLCSCPICLGTSLLPSGMKVGASDDNLGISVQSLAHDVPRVAKGGGRA